MKKRIIYIAILLFGISRIAYSQSDFKISEQVFSRINQNPAAIGNDEDIQLFTFTRLQWMRIENSPISTLLNGHYYNKKIKSGIGLVFSYDQYGIANQTVNAKAAYAYNVDLFKDAFLSFGLSAGVIYKHFDMEKHRWPNPNDPFIPQQSMNNTSFDMDFGLEFSYRYLSAGASITHLTKIAQEVKTGFVPSHINAYVRGIIPIADQFTIFPAVTYVNLGALNKKIAYPIAQNNLFDINIVAMYQKKYWFGVGYQINTAVSFMAGFEWNFLRIGYCYDLSVGKTFNLSVNTHEIMLSFIIPTQQVRKIEEPNLKTKRESKLIKNTLKTKYKNK